jgi:3-methyl-2-oxobutanoate hydroxymethyltransferase
MLRSAAIRSTIKSLPCSNSFTSSLPQSFSPILSCFSSFVCFRSFSSATRPGYPLRPKVTPLELQKLRQSGKPITMVTAYTFPSAMHVDTAGIDVLLVGDSLGMVELGHDTTLPVTMDEMLYHCKAVARGASRPLLVGDMPFGSYEASPEQAYLNAIRFLKEGGMDCVKLEGGAANNVKTVEKLVQGGVAVMGHIGLTPQRISVLGGFRAQGKSMKAAKELIEQAKQLEKAGCFALVIECVPALVAEAITKCVEIPTIGIGAGPYTSGQVLVYHDLLGMLQHEHHKKVTPSFCKSYGKVGDIIQQCLDQYKKEVESGAFPGEEYSPYTMNHEEALLFQSVIVKELEEQGIHLKGDLSTLTKRKKANQTLKQTQQEKPNTDEDGIIKVY